MNWKTSKPGLVMDQLRRKTGRMCRFGCYDLVGTGNMVHGQIIPETHDVTNAVVGYDVPFVAQASPQVAEGLRQRARSRVSE